MFRLRKLQCRRSECKKPWEETGQVFKFPGKFPIFKIGYVKEAPRWGKEEEVSNNARGGFDNCQSKVSSEEQYRIQLDNTNTCLLVLFQTCRKEGTA